ncbi:alpha/beta fold hydrolase [Paraburkholderia oxyphila]|uniref:alpha/beta fold hydrolase n=1 Tax=Paraburkholderia oxyphila TaxID=614212 RepID=UPI000693586B|nr:alpha/beta fold hydrolase [Paraburkholderia oxyphila]
MSERIVGRVQVERQWLAYSRSAPAPSVVLLHGIPTSRYLWRNITKLLSAAGHGWIAFDLLGYGESDKPLGVDPGIREQARFISSALHQLGWAGGTIVGHDIGGGVAQLLGLDESLKIDRLVLVDSVAYDSFPEPGIARLKEPVWEQILGAPDFDLKKGLLKGLQKGIVHSDKVTLELVDQYERPFSGVAGRLAYLRAARSLRSEDLVSRSHEIERLAIPVLLVWGSMDAFQPLRFAQRLATALPNARLEVIESAGHFLPEDVPDALGELIVNFLEAAE